MSFYYDIYVIRPEISSLCLCITVFCLPSLQYLSTRSLVQLLRSLHFTLVHVLQTTCALAMWVRTVSHMMLKNVASTAVAHAI